MSAVSGSERQDDVTAVSEEEISLTSLYKELRRYAATLLRAERPGHTLQATALVHEAFVRLSGQQSEQWECEARLFGATARIMRQVLTDHARKRNRQKRGGGWVRVTLRGMPDSDGPTRLDLLALDEAIAKLASLNERHAQIVEMRFFAGLSIREVAVVLNISERTVELNWRAARAWLDRELSHQSSTEGAET